MQQPARAAADADTPDEPVRREHSTGPAVWRSQVRSVIGKYQKVAASAAWSRRRFSEQPSRWYSEQTETRIDRLDNVLAAAREGRKSSWVRAHAAAEIDLRRPDPALTLEQGSVCPDSRSLEIRSRRLTPSTDESGEWRIQPQPLATSQLPEGTIGSPPPQHPADGILKADCVLAMKPPKGARRKD